MRIRTPHERAIRNPQSAIRNQGLVHPQRRADLGRGRSCRPPARCAARAARPDRYEGRLRRGRVRRLHGVARWASRELLPRARVPDARRTRRHRGVARPGRPRAAACARRDAMRRVYAGRRDDGVLDPRAPRPVGHAHRAGAARGQPVPLYRLRRHCGRGAGGAGWERAGVSVALPSSLPDALAMLAERPEAVPVAGGTDLFVHWPARVAEHDRHYMDLSGIAELKTIAFRNGELVLGALATYWEVIHAGRMQEGFPLLVAAARQVGAVQIQARGTWGGNIANASPAADGVPVLMAYDAVVVLESASGRREELPLDRFYTGYKQLRRRPDQLVVAVRIPWREHDVAIFEKVGGRRAQAIARGGLAITHSAAGWRVVAASVAPTVRRCPAIEQLLDDGTTVRGPDDLLPAIERDVAPIDDLRSTEEYRKRVLARLLYYDLRGVAPAFS